MQIVSYFVTEQSGNLAVVRPNQFETFTKDDDGDSKLRLRSSIRSSIALRSVRTCLCRS